MAALKTEITEIVTGLAMLGDETIDAALGSGVPASLLDVDEATWRRITTAFDERTHERDFLAAWNNGRAFLAAQDGLRGRPPLRVEWKGPHRDPGDTVVPADLRVDHVYLISCKYLSKVLHNASPAALFDRHLVGAQGRRSGTDWFDEVAAAEHQELYQLVRRHHGSPVELPEAVGQIDKHQRGMLRRAIPKDWHDDCAAANARLVARTATESAARWNVGLDTARARQAMLWRLLRLSAAPYFVLGTSAAASVRMRVGTPWDFSRRFTLRDLTIAARPAGQATVVWQAVVSDAVESTDVTIGGHVEIRWTHGRFGGPPEAKVYLDTPISRVPGYVTLR